jgi:hypothetical protein
MRTSAFSIYNYEQQCVMKQLITQHTCYCITFIIVQCPLGDFFGAYYYGEILSMKKSPSAS